MPTVFEQLGEFLKGADRPGMAVTYRSNGLLVTVAISNGRRQIVKVSSHRGGAGDVDLIRLQSRVCIAREPAIVREMLVANAGLELGGFALDTSVSPNAIDVVYSIARDELDFPNFVIILERLACFADAYEERLTGRDDF